VPAGINPSSRPCKLIVFTVHSTASVPNQSLSMSTDVVVFGHGVAQLRRLAAIPIRVFDKASVLCGWFPHVSRKKPQGTQRNAEENLVLASDLCAPFAVFAPLR